MIYGFLHFLLSVLFVIVMFVIGYKIEKNIDRFFGKDSWATRILCGLIGAIFAGAIVLTINVIYNI